MSSRRERGSLPDQAAATTKRPERVPPRGAARRTVGLLTHRWPTWLALAFIVVGLGDAEPPPVDTFAWLLLALPGAYLLFGAVRGELRPLGVLLLQLAALAVYATLAGIALSLADDTARYVVGAGWIVHAGWDIAHHRAQRVVPRAWAEWCAVVDLFIGAALIFFR